MNLKNSILIVDDKPENLIALEKLLNGFDCTIIKANSGNEALTLTLTHEFALALIDVQMPDMDGYETVRLMRNVEQTRFLPVIFLSAIYSENHYQIQGIEAGAVDFISKPIHPRILQGKVKVFLELYEQRKQLEIEIEQRKATEQSLRQTEKELNIAKEKAEESDQLKTAFLANMSHEIRTPLNAIVGFSNLLSDPGTSIEKKSQFKEYIYNSSDTLTALINDIVDVAKIESGQFEMHSTPILISELLQELFATNQVILNRLSKNEIQLNLTIPPNFEKYCLTIDGIRLKQVINNLLTNAIKFTHKGNIEFGVRLTKENKPLFFVYDTGIGISEEQQTVIFDPFRQISQENNANISGTGLGLSIVKKIISLMNGTITIKSEVGEGSQFEFILDCVPCEQQQIAAKATETEITIQNQHLENLRILIAEDEIINYEFLKAIIPNGATLDWAQDGQEAIKMAKANKYDIVLMDLKMPGKTGYQALQEIRTISPKMPIIAQTAYAMEGEKEQILDFGFDDYIAKPIKSVDLLNMIARLTKK